MTSDAATHGNEDLAQNLGQNQTDNSPPIETVKAGSFRIKVWRQRSREGDVYHSFTQERSYTTDDGESWEQTPTARERDLSDLASAYQYLNEKYGLEIDSNPGGGQ